MLDVIKDDDIELIDNLTYEVIKWNAKKPLENTTKISLVDLSNKSLEKFTKQNIGMNWPMSRSIVFVTDSEARAIITTFELFSTFVKLNTR